MPDWLNIDQRVDHAIQQVDQMLDTRIKQAGAMVDDKLDRLQELVNEMKIIVEVKPQIAPRPSSQKV